MFMFIQKVGWTKLVYGYGYELYGKDVFVDYNESFLIRDQFRAQRIERIKKKVAELKTEIAVIPGGLTSQL